MKYVSDFFVDVNVDIEDIIKAMINSKDEKPSSFPMWLVAMTDIVKQQRNENLLN